MISVRIERAAAGAVAFACSSPQMLVLSCAGVVLRDRHKYCDFRCSYQEPCLTMMHRVRMMAMLLLVVMLLSSNVPGAHFRHCEPADFLRGWQGKGFHACDERTLQPRLTCPLLFVRFCSGSHAARAFMVLPTSDDGAILFGLINKL